MKTETEKAKKLIEEYDKWHTDKNDPEENYCKLHKQACQRFLDFLEETLNKGFWRKDDAPSFRRKFHIEEKIQDLKTAIKLYEKEGI